MSGGNLYNRHAKSLGETRGVNADSGAAGQVAHIQNKQYGDSRLNQLDRQIQVSTQVARVDDVDDQVGAPPGEEVPGDPFVRRLGRQRGHPRKIDDVEPSARTVVEAFRFFNRHSGIIAHPLAQPGQRVEYGGLAGIRIPRQADPPAVRRDGPFQLGFHGLQGTGVCDSKVSRLCGETSDSTVHDSAAIGSTSIPSASLPDNERRHPSTSIRTGPPRGARRTICIVVPRTTPSSMNLRRFSMGTWTRHTRPDSPTGRRVSRIEPFGFVRQSFLRTVKRMVKQESFCFVPRHRGVVNPNSRHVSRVAICK